MLKFKVTEEKQELSNSWEGRPCSALTLVHGIMTVHGWNADMIYKL